MAWGLSEAVLFPSSFDLYGKFIMCRFRTPNKHLKIIFLYKSIFEICIRIIILLNIERYNFLILSILSSFLITCLLELPPVLDLQLHCIRSLYRKKAVYRRLYILPLDEDWDVIVILAAYTYFLLLRHLGRQSNPIVSTIIMCGIPTSHWLVCISFEISPIKFYRPAYFL